MGDFLKASRYHFGERMYLKVDLLTALYLVISPCVTAGKRINSVKFTLGSHSPQPFKAPSPDAQAQHVLTLTAKPGTSKSAGYLQSIRTGKHVNGVYSLTSATYSAGQISLIADIKFGTQSLQALLDTGSSDTWVVGKGFECLDKTTGSPQPESACEYGPTYTLSPTFKRIPNETFAITYGDNSYLSGIFGNESIIFAGLPIYDQQIAVVDIAQDALDGVSSGLIGLAFPSLTNAYAGNGTHVSNEKIVYNPILTNLFSQGHIAPVFSLAMERSSNFSGVTAGGFLAIGGLPPVRSSPNFASAPFELVTVDDDNKPLKTPHYGFYTITVTGFRYERSEETKWTHPIFPSPLGPLTNSSQLQVIVDTGSTLTYLPNGIAEAVNALFDPPAVYDADSGTYAVNCSAKAPEFGVKIGEQTFFINEEDLIARERENGTCRSGIARADSGPSTLGLSFLKGVLAVFDVGASEMRFASRQFY